MRLDRPQFQFKLYHRPFKQPLMTHHGVWAVREGIILRLSDASGRVGWGEIAPIAAFGSEGLEQALALCRSLSGEVAWEAIEQIPSEFPACQFGFESAWEGLQRSPLAPLKTGGDRATHNPLKYEQFILSEVSLSKGDLRGSSYTRVSMPQENSVLLPTGSAALESWRIPWQRGARTFKWKIGVGAIASELALFEQLITALPKGTQLRLDANGGLNEQQARQWLERCDAVSKRDGVEVEFLEQPLPPRQFDQMLRLSQQFHTPIALDESVANLAQLQRCYQQGWRGIFVIKVAIVGSPQQLRQFCQQHPIDIVWSSVFETAIARTYIQNHLIPSIPTKERAIGFGVDHWFAESLFSDLQTESDYEQLWQNL